MAWAIACPRPAPNAIVRCRHSTCPDGKAPIGRTGSAARSAPDATADGLVVYEKGKIVFRMKPALGRLPRPQHHQETGAPAPLRGSGLPLNERRASSPAQASHNIRPLPWPPIDLEM